MPKPKRNKSDEAQANRTDPRRILRRAALHVTLAGILVGSSGYALYRLRDHVARDVAVSTDPPIVVLKSRPAWMSDTLAQRIAASVQPAKPSSSLDHRLLEDITQALQFNPWVREVRQVRRTFAQSAGDTIEIDCEYRTPVALVINNNGYILVDGEGVRLPEKIPLTPQQLPHAMFGPDGHVTLRIIEGVSALPPYLDGQKWSGDDLAAGLDLVKLLYGRACTDEIYKVNVSNYKGRKNPREPQLTLITKYNSIIYWGEPSRQSFYVELHPTEKLERLALFKERYGRVDCGYSWVDIRMDKPLNPEPEPPSGRIAQVTGARPQPRIAQTGPRPRASAHN